MRQEKAMLNDNQIAQITRAEILPFWSPTYGALGRYGA